MSLRWDAWKRTHIVTSSHLAREWNPLDRMLVHSLPVFEPDPFVSSQGSAEKESQEAGRCSWQEQQQHKPAERLALGRESDLRSGWFFVCVQIWGVKQLVRNPWASRRYSYFRKKESEKDQSINQNTREATKEGLHNALSPARDVIKTMVTIRNDYTGKSRHEVREWDVGAGIALAPRWRVIRFQSLKR